MIPAGSRLRDKHVGQNQGAGLPGAAGLRYDNAGVSQQLRQLLTGHASKAINDRYTRTDLKTLRKAVELVPSVALDRVHFTGGTGTPGESGPPSGTEAKDLIKWPSEAS